MTAPGTGTAGPPVAPPGRAVAVTGVVEATSYLVLLVTAGWRLLLDGPDLAGLVGPVHGIAFLAYCGAVLVAREDAGWTPGRTAVLLGAAIVPGGGFAAAGHLGGTRSPAPGG